MTKRVTVLIVLIASFLLIVFIFFTLLGEYKKDDNYSVRLFNSGEGWGYQINKNKQVIIIQPYMPCVEGNIPFTDQKSALKIAELVIFKIKNKQEPSISIEELNKVVKVSDF